MYKKRFPLTSFNQIMGVVDAIKPITQDLFLAVTEHILRKFTSDNAKISGALDIMAEEPHKKSKGGGHEQQAEHIHLVPKPTDAVVQPYKESTADSQNEFKQWLKNYIEGLEVQDLGQLLSQLQKDTQRSSLGFWGALSVIPLSEVFQLLQMERLSGGLHLELETVGCLDVFFRTGQVEFAMGYNLGHEFLLGRFLVEQGSITEKDLADVLRARGNDKHLLGKQLLKLNYIQARDLSHALKHQCAALIYEILRWGEGTFHFVSGEERSVEWQDVHLALDVDKLLLEGYRRVDEWRSIEKAVPSLDLVFSKNSKAESCLSELKPKENIILRLVDGVNTVRRIITLSCMSSFDVCKLLYGLLVAEIITAKSLAVEERANE